MTATILSLTAIAGLAIEDVDRDYGDSAFYWHPAVVKEWIVVRRCVVNSVGNVGEELSGGIFAKGSKGNRVISSTGAQFSDYTCVGQRCEERDTCLKENGI